MNSLLIACHACNLEKPIPLAAILIELLLSNLKNFKYRSTTRISGFSIRFLTVYLQRSLLNLMHKHATNYALNVVFNAKNPSLH